jgi:hypothetical protein
MTAWIVRHRVAAPMGLGFASGLVAGPLWLGSAVPGYLVGRAGLGAALPVGGLIAGFVCTAAWLVNGMVTSGCPSCIDALIVLPWVFPFLLVPFGVGYWLGKRSYRAARTSSTEALTELNRLADAGLITPPEYESKRGEILSRL